MSSISFARAGLTIALEPACLCGRDECVCDLLGNGPPDFLEPGEPRRIVPRDYVHGPGWVIEVLSDCGRFWIEVDNAGRCFMCECTESEGCGWADEHENLCDRCVAEHQLDLAGSDSNETNRERLNAILDDVIHSAVVEPGPDTLADVLIFGRPVEELTLAEILSCELWMLIESDGACWSGRELPWRGEWPTCHELLLHAWEAESQAGAYDQQYDREIVGWGGPEHAPREVLDILFKVDQATRRAAFLRASAEALSKEGGES